MLQGSDYPDDTGEASPRLAAALAGYAVDETRYPDVLAALGAARLLVPVVAVLGEVETGADGLAHDKSSDMATVLLQGADGRAALLAFTSTDTLAAWNPEGRPVAVPTRTAAALGASRRAPTRCWSTSPARSPSPSRGRTCGRSRRAGGWRGPGAGSAWVAPAD